MNWGRWVWLWEWILIQNPCWVCSKGTLTNKPVMRMSSSVWWSMQIIALWVLGANFLLSQMSLFGSGFVSHFCMEPSELPLNTSGSNVICIGGRLSSSPGANSMGTWIVEMLTSELLSGVLDFELMDIPAVLFLFSCSTNSTICVLCFQQEGKQSRNLLVMEFEEHLDHTLLSYTISQLFWTYNFNRCLFTSPGKGGVVTCPNWSPLSWEVVEVLMVFRTLFTLNFFRSGRISVMSFINSLSLYARLWATMTTSTQLVWPCRTRCGAHRSYFQMTIFRSTDIPITRFLTVQCKTYWKTHPNEYDENLANRCFLERKGVPYEIICTKY